MRTIAAELHFVRMRYSFSLLEIWYAINHKYFPEGVTVPDLLHYLEFNHKTVANMFKQMSVFCFCLYRSYFV